MKNYKLPAFLIALFFTVANVAVAQYDDIYYDPEKDATYDDYRGDRYSSTDRYNARYSEPEQETYYHDDDEYEYYDDYDYHYTSRIRRFHRPFYGFDYYDPIYVDMFYYDPFFSPAMTVLIYNNNFSYWNWRRWNRWNRFYRYDPWYAGGMWSPYYGFYDPFMFRPGFGAGAWGWGGGFGFNSWGWGSGFSNFYCPPAWGNNYYYNTVSVVNNDYNTGYRSYYGPRRNGTTTIARNNDRIYRGTTTPTPVDVTTRNANTANGRSYTNPAVNTTDPNTISRGRTADRTTDTGITGAQTRTGVNTGDRITDDRSPRTASPAYDASGRTATRPIDRTATPAPRTASPDLSPRSRTASPSTQPSNTTRRSLFGDNTTRERSMTTPSTRTDRSYTPRSSEPSSRSYTPRSSAPSSRSYTPRSSAPSSRSYTPRSSSGSSSSRSYTPSRSSSGSSRSYSPSSSGSSRSYSPSSSGSSRSYTPSSSSGSSRSYTPSRSSSSGSSSSPARRGGGNE